MSIDNLWTAGVIFLAIALIVKRIVFWWRVKNKQRRIVKEVLSLYKSDRTFSDLIPDRYRQKTKLLLDT